MEKEKALAYAISAGIAGFGAWIVTAGYGSDATIIWACIGSMPIVIGLLSAVSEWRDG